MTATDEQAPAPSKRRPSILREALIALVAVALVQAFLIKPFSVPSQSMENTLHIGDRIAVNRLDSSIDHGDIVVFGHGETWATPHRAPAPDLLRTVVRRVGDITGIGPSNTSYTVKRVIGLPGDRISCCGAAGEVLRNGKPLTEPYVFEDLPFIAGTADCDTSPRSSRCFPEIAVPKDMLLVMGDHRSQSADSVISCRGSTRGSECAQFVPMARVVGPVVARFWPLTALGSPN